MTRLTAWIVACLLALAAGSTVLALISSRYDGIPGLIVGFVCGGVTAAAVFTALKEGPRALVQILRTSTRR